MNTEIIEKINGFVSKTSGQITIKITPKKFGIISNEESGQIVLNEILILLGFAPVDSLDKCIIEDEK